MNFRKTKQVFTILFVCFYGGAMAQVVVKDETYDCNNQPHNITETEKIILENVIYEACENVSDSYITSTEEIDLVGETDINVNNNTVELFISKLDVGSFIHTQTDLSMDYIPIYGDLNIVYIEEYLDNVDLHYKVYKFKGDPDQATYYPNNQVAPIVNRGENYITIPLGDLSNGLYTLEITGQKGKKTYVKFKKN